MIDKFTLGAVEWKVKVDDSKLDDKGVYGESIFTEATILMQEKSGGVKMPKSLVEQTLYHEVTHAMLDTLGEHELSANEEFVQKFSLLLHQFEKTKK